MEKIEALIDTGYNGDVYKVVQFTGSSPEPKKYQSL
jgi:hypothetical protein